MAIITLTDIRRSLAKRIGGYLLFTSGVQTEPPSGAYTGVAADSADIRRNIVSTDLAVLNVGGTTTPVATDRWKYASVYIPSLTLQRMVAEEGYYGAKIAADYTSLSGAPYTTTYLGMLALAEQLPTAGVLAATPVELHSKMPVIGREGFGLHDCLNRALRAMVIRDTITITKISGASRYSLAAYPWLTEDDQLIGVRDSESLSATDGDLLYEGGAIRQDGETSYLLLNTAPSSTTFSIDVWRPMASWVRVGGTWQASTAGLVNETDAVVVDPDWLTYLAYYYACEALARAWYKDAVGSFWANERESCAATCEKRLAQERSLDTPLPRKGATSSIHSSDIGLSGAPSWP